ncbi:hypothetical protein K432DRAFT_296109 [Lepidopterella palustris CBS 459.81]|uniref:Heterokaryon incompatibility domain-containing protein n=1 Tax=Lepidopterella palustris CBS 459.81 TaxID=1314670 RepID=A0A8E2JG28_9PEZI|nr:hypothetical protein K432DRAFT_296109 [Lepidopterella palustris CBS 459.81]
MSAPLLRPGQCELLDVGKDDLDTSHLNAHILREESRQLLVKYRHPWATTATIDAETLLGNLSQLAPAVAERFAPKSKSLNGLVFRLVNDTDRSGDEATYIAMSYCWRKVHQRPPVKNVSAPGALPFGWVKTVEQFPLPTTPAMFQAVLRQRESEYEGLWFDQVCINQDDEAEKAVSIGAMDSIYKNARTVVIALDDIEADPDEVAFLRHYIESYSHSMEPLARQPNYGHRPPFMQTQPAFKSFFERVLSSLWFERAWCGHEMRLGKTHIFLVPCRSSDQDESYTFIKFTGVFFLHMLTLSSEIMSTVPGHQARKTTLQQLFGRRALIYEREAFLLKNPGTKFAPLPEPVIYVPLIAEVFQMKAGGNPRLPDHLRILDANRDKVSIVLNTIGYPLALKPPTAMQSPSTEDECLRQLLLIGLAANDPVALCTTGPPLLLHNGSISWLRRPTPLDVVSAGQLLPHFPRMKTFISLGFDGRAEYVQLDLIFLEFPQRHRADSDVIWQNHLHRANAFIDNCMQHHIESYTMWSSWQAPSHPRAPSMKNVFVQTLACCFECGPTWTTQVCHRFQVGSYGLTSEAIDILFNPYLVLHNHIATPDGRQDITYLLNFLSILVAYGIPWSSGATEMTCGPIPVSIGVAGVAIIFAPFKYSRILRVAVPHAIQDTAYDSLSRGWILTPINTGSIPSDWALQEKSVIFGDSAFNQALSMQLGPNQQRVYGPVAP